MRAVIFDMDGVLIDSEPAWQAAEVEVFSALGVPISVSDCSNTTGLRIQEAVQWWFDRHPWEGASIDVVAQRIVQKVAAHIRSHGKALPGIGDAWMAVQHSGHADAIATSSPPAIIDAVVERLRFLSPQVICSAADEVAGKPDPAVYLTAARRLGIAPADCLAIEDSEVGVAAAKAAGMKVVAVQPVSADWNVPTPDLAAFLHREWLHWRAIR